MFLFCFFNPRMQQTRASNSAHRQSEEEKQKLQRFMQYMLGYDTLAHNPDALWSDEAEQGLIEQPHTHTHAHRHMTFQSQRNSDHDHIMFTFSMAVDVTCRPASTVPFHIPVFLISPNQSLLSCLFVVCAFDLAAQLQHRTLCSLHTRFSD